jgi:hypothetical protein
MFFIIFQKFKKVFKLKMLKKLRFLSEKWSFLLEKWINFWTFLMKNHNSEESKF